MSSLFSSLAEKAQIAIDASPLAGHVPKIINKPLDQPPANQAASQGGAKSHTLEAIQHQIRSFGQQYTSVTPVQKIITSEKGVAIDFDAISRDSKAQSKELYTWGQGEAADIKDVTDRLAYLNFVQGSLAATLAVRLDSARSSFKHLRDSETAIAPRRNVRAGMQLQISRVEHEQQKGNEQRLKDLRQQLAQLEVQDAEAEREIEVLKRKAVRDSEQIKWDAIREYGEKLVLLSQAASQMISVLPYASPSKLEPYTGAPSTAASRASLQRALDNYKTGHINLSPTTGADLSRQDTRSFGESHASELSSISSSVSSIPMTPPAGSQPLPPTSYKEPKTEASPPLNPLALNMAPTPIPIPATNAFPPVNSDGEEIPSPTIAETGVPVVAGASGPGPASGSLLDKHAASPSAVPGSGGLPGKKPSTYGQIETAEEEKARLARQEREGILAAGGSIATPPPQTAVTYETAEEEKKRLERQHREELLTGKVSSSGPPSGGNNDELPPSYQDM